MNTLETPLTVSIDHEPYAVALMDGQAVLSRWEAVEHAARAAFTGAQFSNDEKDDQIENDKRSFLNDPIAHIKAGAEGELRSGLVHAVAIDEENNVAGGVFCIPQQRWADEADCQMGWVFTAKELSPRARVFVVDSLIELAYATAIDDAQFERIVVSMGTVAGAKAITRRYGLVFEPTPVRQNRWVATPESFTEARQKRSQIRLT